MNSFNCEYDNLILFIETLLTIDKMQINLIYRAAHMAEICSQVNPY